MIEPGRVLAERYVLERLLGAGGMGQVWIARHTKLERLVAIKLMTPEAHASGVLRARFEREAKACAQLRSPHVVQVFDYGVEGDTPFLVMELLEGEDLAALQAARPVWSLAEVASIVRQAARGLGEAHDAGIVHRDIKLSNLFVARLPGESVVKILDFGIAKAFENDGPKMTGTNIQLGTPSYMSPEQVLSQPVDHRADVWALTVVAFRLLTGQPAFAGESSILVAQKIVLGERRRLADLVDDLPAALESFFDRGFAAQPADRFPSAQDLAGALTRLAEAHPSAVGRPHARGAAVAPTTLEAGDTTSVPTERARIPEPSPGPFVRPVMKTARMQAVTGPTPAPVAAPSELTPRTAARPAPSLPSPASPATTSRAPMRAMPDVSPPVPVSAAPVPGPAPPFGQPGPPPPASRGPIPPTPSRAGPWRVLQGAAALMLLVGVAAGGSWLLRRSAADTGSPAGSTAAPARPPGAVEEPVAAEVLLGDTSAPIVPSASPSAVPAPTEIASSPPSSSPPKPSVQPPRDVRPAVKNPRPPANGSSRDVLDTAR